MPLSLYQIVAANNLPTGSSYMDATAGVTYLVNVLQDLKATIRTASLQQPWVSFLGLTGSWTGGLAWTQISGTQASIQGDQSVATGTAYLQVGQTVRAFVTGPPSTIYGTIVAISVAAGITTVTFTWKSGALDSGLTDIQTYGSTLAGGSNAKSVMGGVTCSATATSTSMSCTVTNALLTNGAGGGTPLLASFTATLNIATAGPALNGRDQAGAFTVSTFIHVYALGGGPSLGTIASANGPSVGPNLPTGYSFWAYMGTFLLDGTGNFVNCWMNGQHVYYAGLQSVLNGSSSTEANVVVTSAVPTVALLWRAVGSVVITSGTQAGVTANLRWLTGVNVLTIERDIASGQGSGVYGSFTPFEMPVTGNGFYYLVTPSGGGTSPGIQVFVTGYDVPNGA